jgi:hypothetical protein
MLRKGEWIASIEPLLTEVTPREVIGFERAAVGLATSAIGHIRLRS